MMINETLRSRILRKLDALTDEEARQLLDYADFLTSKHNRSRRSPSPLERIGETIEGTFGSERISRMAARGTAQIVGAAGRVMEGLAAASRVVSDELQAPPRTVDEDEEAVASNGGGDAAEQGTAPEDRAGPAQPTDPDAERPPGTA